MYVAPPIGPVLLIGTLLILFGAALVRRWVARRRGWHAPKGLVTLASIALAIVVGLFLIASAVTMSFDFVRAQNTRSLKYRVTVLSLTGEPVTLLLPAPEDPRFWAGLGRTNGTSTLRLLDDGPTASVEVRATAGVTFQVHLRFEAASLDADLTRVSSAVPPQDSNVDVEVSLAGEGFGSASAHVVPKISVGASCVQNKLQLEADVTEGLHRYGAFYVTVAC